jgi:hypothetical protein
VTDARVNPFGEQPAAVSLRREFGRFDSTTRPATQIAKSGIATAISTGFVPKSTASSGRRAMKMAAARSRIDT